MFLKVGELYGRLDGHLYLAILKILSALTDDPGIASRSRAILATRGHFSLAVF